MTRTRIYVSFDRENDSDLSELLNAQSRRPGSTFEVMKSQHHKTARPGWDTDTRTRIQAADEILVICGEHTHESMLVSLELAIAQEEDRPYMLLWGRRDKMCMKPDGARKRDAMYSWTRAILESQISATIRDSKPLVVPENCKRIQPRRESDSPTRDGQPS
jgi:hypothetical protein